MLWGCLDGLGRMWKMVAITISVDLKTYEYLRWYQDRTGIENISKAARLLIQKGIAHEKAIAYQEADLAKSKEGRER